MLFRSKERKKRERVFNVGFLRNIRSLCFSYPKQIFNHASLFLSVFRIPYDQKNIKIYTFILLSFIISNKFRLPPFDSGITIIMNKHVSWSHLLYQGGSLGLTLHRHVCVYIYFKQVKSLITLMCPIFTIKKEKKERKK